MSNIFEENEAQKMLEEIARENGFENPEFEVSSATKPGDNVMGRVFRVLVREEGRDPLSLIFKIAPASKIRREAFMSGINFHNEGNMYKIILPTLNVLLRDNGLSESESYPCTPRLFALKLSASSNDNAMDIIVLEDMAVKEYCMFERSAGGLDLEKCRASLLHLARLHAASLGLRQKHPGKARQIEAKLREATNEGNTSLIQQIAPLAQMGLSLIEDRYPVGSSEYTKLKSFVDSYVEEYVKLVKPDDTLSCVVHGDCWSNNILFKSDKEGRLEDICLIDFQLSKVASPVLDVVYLIFICTTKEMRDVHYEGLLHEYHSEVTSLLEALGCDAETIFSWAMFQDHLIKYGRFGLTMGLVAIPIFLTEQSEAPDDVDGMMESKQANVSDVFSRVNKKNLDECKKRVSDVVQDMIQLGYL